MIGDSVWDAEAAGRAGIGTYAVLTGGFSVEELESAGAKRVYESLQELQDDLDAIVAG
jgi:phosphoglycolate phosphatase-like HAD superfamily hydrolase